MELDVNKQMFGEHTISGFHGDYAVIAWMPLPIPYERKEEWQNLITVSIVHTDCRVESVQERILIALFLVEQSTWHGQQKART